MESVLLSADTTGKENSDNLTEFNALKPIYL